MCSELMHYTLLNKALSNTIDNHTHIHIHDRVCVYILNVIIIDGSMKGLLSKGARVCEGVRSSANQIY